MYCPNDKTSLQEILIGDLHVHACARCHGVWFEFGELRSLVQRFQYEPAKTVFDRWQALPGDGKTSPGDLSHEADHQCPYDGTAMDKHYYGGDSGVGIDHCNTCGGFWFAGSELAALIDYIKPNPTLDRAVQTWAKEMQNQYPDRNILSPNKPDGYGMLIDSLVLATGHGTPAVAVGLLHSAIEGSVDVISRGFGSMVA